MIKTVFLTVVFLLLQACGGGSATTPSTPNPFVTVWETNSNDFNITIPTNSNYTYNYDIDWGDGSSDTAVTGNITHIYSSEGNWTVKISGEFPHMKMVNTFPSSQEETENAHQLLKVTSWGDIKWKDMSYMFANCDRFNIEANDKPILKDVEDMSYMFRYTISINAPIDDWDVSNIKNMSNMFSASKFNQDISNWNVSNVTNMEHMFSLSVFDQNISDWDVSNVTNMEAMFFMSKFNQDISNWDVSNVTNMERMFDWSKFDQDISNWDVSSVTDMSRMFYYATSFKNHDLSSWDVSNVTDHTDFATGSGGITEPIWP